MHRFKTKFEPDEHMVFGPVSKVDPKVSEHTPGVHQITASPEIMRTVGITNKRLIVETGSRIVTISNPKVVRLWLRRVKSKQGSPTYVLQYAHCSGGQNVVLDIPSLEPNTEELLHQTFPNVELVVKQGWLANVRNRLSFWNN